MPTPTIQLQKTSSKNSVALMRCSLTHNNARSTTALVKLASVAQVAVATPLVVVALAIFSKHSSVVIHPLVAVEMALVDAGKMPAHHVGKTLKSLPISPLNKQCSAELFPLHCALLCAVTIVRVQVRGRAQSRLPVPIAMAQAKCVVCARVCWVKWCRLRRANVAVALAKWCLRHAPPARVTVAS